MKIKLWIIYKEEIGFSRVIAEMLEDRLEDYIDIDVGRANKIDPSYLVEERLDYLIVGDVVSKKTPCPEIQNWLIAFWDILKKQKISLGAISGYYVTISDVSIEPTWIEFLHNNLKIEKNFQSIFRLKLNLATLSLEDRALELINQYSKDIVEFIINNEK